MLGAQLLRAAQAAVHFQGVGVDEAGAAGQYRHPVALVEAAAQRHLLLNHPPGAGEQLREGQAQGTAELAQQGLVLEVAEGLYRVPQRLAGNGAPVGAAAADVEMALDHDRLQAIFGGHHRRTLAARPAADHCQVVMLHVDISYYGKGCVAFARMMTDWLT